MLIFNKLRLCVYLRRFIRYSNFLIGWDFPNGAKCRCLGGGQNNPHNVIIEEARVGRHIFAPHCVLWAILLEQLSLSVWPVQVRKKNNKGSN